MSKSQRRGLRSTAATATVVESVEEHSQRTQASESLTDSQLTSQLNLAQGEEEDSSDNEEVEEYGEMHQLVLQGMLAAGYLDAKGVKKLFQEASKFLQAELPEGAGIYPYIQKVVREINDRIKFLELMIRSATCEITGEKFYVFLVTSEMPIMKAQNYFTKLELDFFQKVMNIMLRERNDFAMSRIDCVNILNNFEVPSQGRAYSKINAEDFIDRMIGLKYYSKIYKDNDTNKDENDRDYVITLGFRTIREFEPIFRDAYSDIFGTCILCKLILLNGHQCPKCPVLVHKACLKKYLKSCKSCVTCKVPWKNEAALPSRTRDGVSSGSSQEGSSQTGKPKEATNIQDEDVDMPVLEPESSPRIIASSKRGKKDKQAAVAATATQTMHAAKRKAKLTLDLSEESDSE